MHTDENKMNFLRHVLNTMPHITVRQAFTLLDGATESFPAETHGITPLRYDGVWWEGVFFPFTADEYMRNDDKISAIREVRAANRSTADFGLKQVKDAVDARMRFEGWPG